MSILTNFMSVLTADIRTTIICLIISFIVYKLSKFYWKVFSLPPGPIPLPILGNILLFRGTKDHWTQELEKIGRKYGPVFTFWTGTFPVVYISDLDIAREAFKKTEFSGLPQSVIRDIMTEGIHTGVSSADYGHQWEALRRVAHSAVQKYSTTDRLVYLVSDCVDHTINTMVEKEGLNKPFDPTEYIYSTFFNILATTAFGVRYKTDDTEYKAIKYVQSDIWAEVDNKLLFWEMFPIMKKTVDRRLLNKIMNGFKKNIEVIKEKFKSHYKDYDESIVRDFCDTLITAKNDALRDGKESAPYLNDENLTLVVFDLFFAGSATTQITFQWILFSMKYFPEVEKRLRQEIETEIGDRIPTHEDRERCHYVMAVISETLRLNNITPQGTNHRAVVTSKIGDFIIPKDTQVALFQGSILQNEEYFPNAQDFRPERFLQNGKYITTRPKGYIPFGIGRRVCLGEKLALADLFLVVVRFIQKTADFDLELHYSGDHQCDPDNMAIIYPKPYKISLNKKLA